VRRTGVAIALVVAAVVARVPVANAATGAGAFAVGVTTITFTKTSVTTGAPRPLATVIWYPAVARTGTPEELGLRDAEVRRRRFPLIVFSHGSCGGPDEATYLTKELASQGFIVAAPPHPGNTKADLPGCLDTASFLDSVVNRVPDVRFVIDSMLAENASRFSRFAHRLRPDAIGMSGLSFGGFTTLLAAQEEPRLRAALALVPGGTATLGPNDITIPTMIIGAEHDAVVGFAESEHAYERLAGPRFLIELLAANHLSVVDDCLGGTLCAPGDISQEAAHALVLRYAVPFVQRYVRGDRRPNGLTEIVPGVVVTAGGAR